MNDTFEEWAQESIVPVVAKWWNDLTNAGVTWETFDRDELSICEDLKASVVPRVALRDIIGVVKQHRDAQRRKADMPMAVFWDIENIQIPNNFSGEEIVSCLKKKLQSLGHLENIRAYADGTESKIPPRKRCDLQQSGVHIVDTPHVGKKEAADKMIIVDAMEFAYQHSDGATIVLITGDHDFAYMLARLQKPQWTTVLIARGSMRSVMHVNATSTLRWEADVLGITAALAPAAALISTEGDGRTAPRELRASEVDDDLVSVAMTEPELLSDDLELVLNTIHQLTISSPAKKVRKSLVGTRLKEQNPIRFANRVAIRLVLAEAIRRGNVIEEGEGAFKELSLFIADVDATRAASENNLVCPLSTNASKVRDAVQKRCGTPGNPKVCKGQLSNDLISLGLNDKKLREAAIKEAVKQGMIIQHSRDQQNRDITYSLKISHPIDARNAAQC